MSGAETRLVRWSTPTRRRRPSHAEARRSDQPTPRPTATPTSSSSCWSRAATSRWRPGFDGPPRLRGRPVDLLQAASMSPWSGCTASTSHEMQLQPRAARPDAAQLACRADDDGRAGRVVPARHSGDELPPGARQDDDHARGDRSLKPEALRYFHNAGLRELRGEDYRGIFRLDGPVERRCCRHMSVGALRRGFTADG